VNQARRTPHRMKPENENVKSCATLDAEPQAATAVTTNNGKHRVQAVDQWRADQNLSSRPRGKMKSSTKEWLEVDSPMKRRNRHRGW
jgi:hypothetical protein